jgi:hypothetical protein
MVDDKGEYIRYDATLRRQEMQWKENCDQAIHSDRAAVDLGIAALKTVILINAGALVVLLAFVAQVWTKDNGKKIASGILDASDAFVVGLVAGVLAFGIAYIYQSALTRRLWRNVEEISAQSGPLPSIRWLGRIEIACKVIMVILTILSILAFICGALAVKRGFQIPV